MTPREFAALGIRGLKSDSTGGRVMNIVTAMRHPKSGDLFAVEVDDDGQVVRAAGPLHHALPDDEQTLREWLDNAPDADLDGEWLAREVENPTV